MTLTLLVIALALSVFMFIRQPKFGRTPGKKRMETIRASPNYKNGAFQNQRLTPDLTEGATYFSVMKEVLHKPSDTRPPSPIPSTKTDLFHLSPEEEVLVWFGHSSYFIQAGGKRFLVDPVFSGAASPVRFTTKAFEGADIYLPADLPAIDYLLISHDHWDHLDYETVLALKPKIGKVICGLGVGEHFERWGFDTASIIEEDWNKHLVLEAGLTIDTIPARHFSGRGFTRNKALWLSFVLCTPTLSLFIGGDSGYDTHFKKAGEAFGPFDLAILENGQYNKSWKYIHMHPEEVLIAAKDLKAKRLMPVHSAKFSLANHSWNEPLKRIAALSQMKGMSLVTPLIGEKVNLKDSSQEYNPWWELL